MSETIRSPHHRLVRAYALDTGVHFTAEEVRAMVGCDDALLELFNGRAYGTNGWPQDSACQRAAGAPISTEEPEYEAE